MVDIQSHIPSNCEGQDSIPPFFHSPIVLCEGCLTSLWRYFDQEHIMTYYGFIAIPVLDLQIKSTITAQDIHTKV